MLLPRSPHSLTRTFSRLAPTRANNALVCGAEDGTVDVRRAHDLAKVHALDLANHGVPLNLSFSPDDRHLLVAASDGSIVVCSDPKSRLLQLDAALSNTVIGLDTGLFAF